MQKEQGCFEGEEFLKKLVQLEDLAEKKAKIYSRLLMDTAIAKEMEELSLRHEKRKEELVKLFSGKQKEEKESTQNEA